MTESRKEILLSIKSESVGQEFEKSFKTTDDYTRLGFCFCIDRPILAASSGLFADLILSTQSCAIGSSTPTNLCAYALNYMYKNYNKTAKENRISEKKIKYLVVMLNTQPSNIITIFIIHLNGMRREI